jgi:hypothetical protein
MREQKGRRGEEEKMRVEGEGAVEENNEGRIGKEEEIK